MARENIVEELRNYGKRDLLSALGIDTETAWGEMLGPVLGAFGVGLLVGAGFGLLFAPQPGRQLRQDIRQKLSRGAGKAKGIAGEQYEPSYADREDANAPNALPSTPGPM